MKYFKITMSTKDRITIDEDDFLKLSNNISTGNLIKLKKGIVNPSFIVDIFPVSAKEALEDEIPQRKIEGHIDEKTGIFVLDKQEEIISTELRDEF